MIALRYAALLLSVYHILNLARFIRHRHSEAYRLRRWSVATLWIVGLQCGLFGLSVIVGMWGKTSLIALVSMEFLVALVFLQQTLRTWRHIRPQPPAQHFSDGELPSLSVLVPARNETIDLQNCLQALIASDYPKLEIIALDDRSADRRTPEIIRGFAHDGVRFVQGDEAPFGVLPKNHAYTRLAQEASGELLLFIGVDVLVEPHSLRQLVELLLSEKRDMLSLLPMRPKKEARKLSFVQAMRYWWELGFPRRLFNRPPVLSTLWLIRRSALDNSGGFDAVRQMITPEAYFAKRLTATDGYIFIRSTPSLPVYSTKNIHAQYQTAIRVRYPQLHHRMEMVILVSLFEMTFLIAPFLLFPISLVYSVGLYVAILSALTALILSVMYYFIAIRTHLNNLWLGLLTAPVSFTLDILLMHSSMLQYEFGTVIWHDRSQTQPMLEAIKSFPTNEI